MDHFTVAFSVAASLLICTVFSYIVKFRLRRRSFYEKASKFPGPPTLPLIGNAHLLLGDTEAILSTVMKLGKSYPSPYRFWMGNHLMIAVTAPEEMQVVLQSPKTVEKGNHYAFGHRYLGKGLLTATGKKCRIHRKIIQPTFNTAVLNSFIETFSTQSAIMAEKMKRHLDGPEFEISDYTLSAALNTICETAMGVDLQMTGNNDFGKALDEIFAGLSRRVVSPWLYLDSIFYRTNLGKAQTKCIKYLHGFTETVIQKKKEELLDERQAVNKQTTSQSPRKKILLDHLMDVANGGEKFTNEELRNEVNTIIAAGSDTIASVSAGAMLMLANHPEVQEKAYQEQCDVGLDDEIDQVRNFTPEDLKRMPYLERVIKETMRVFPTAPYLTRMATQDVDIGGLTVPEGSIIVLDIIDLHRNGKYWPDPLKFDPDRFLPEEVQKRHPYAHVPFSGGLRSCIGSVYAIMSLKVILATILRKYILKKDTNVPVKDIRLKAEIVLRFVDPITLRIETRSPKVAPL